MKKRPQSNKRCRCGVLGSLHSDEPPYASETTSICDAFVAAQHRVGLTPPTPEEEVKGRPRVAPLCVCADVKSKHKNGVGVCLIRYCDCTGYRPSKKTPQKTLGPHRR